MGKTADISTPSTDSIVLDLAELSSIVGGLSSGKPAPSPNKGTTPKNGGCPEGTSNQRDWAGNLHRCVDWIA
jgi:hypothetical protein